VTKIPAVTGLVTCSSSGSRLTRPGECMGIYTQRRSGLLNSHWSILTSRNVTIVLDESRSRVVLWRYLRLRLPFVL